MEFLKNYLPRDCGSLHAGILPLEKLRALIRIAKT